MYIVCIDNWMLVTTKLFFEKDIPDMSLKSVKTSCRKRVFINAHNLRVTYEIFYGLFNFAGSKYGYYCAGQKISVYDGL